MVEFKRQKTGILRIDNSTVLLMGNIHVPAEDASFIQFEQNHADDHWDNPDKEERGEVEYGN